MRKAVTILIISAIHFGLCRALNHAVLAAAAAHACDGTAAPVSGFLSGLARVLYFPILSLHLYARNWFPGDLILIVLAANSLVWGIAAYGLFTSIRKTRSKGDLS